MPCPKIRRTCVERDCRYNNLAENPQTSRNCALDVADDGEHTLQEVADILGCTRQRVQQIESTALVRIKRWRMLSPELMSEPTETMWDALVTHDGYSSREMSFDTHYASRESTVDKAYKALLRRAQSAEDRESGVRVQEVGDAPSPSDAEADAFAEYLRMAK